MVSPPMHPVEAKLHHFYVPNRILWDGWEDFITGGSDGNNADTPPTIEVPVNNDGETLLMDALGIPTEKSTGAEVNALPIRAYNKIFNEYYRDQDIQPVIPEDNTWIMTAAWEKDYFSSARPFAQKGNDITVPIYGNAAVISDGTEPHFINPAGTDSYITGGVDQQVRISSVGDDLALKFNGTQTGLQADMTAVSGLDINDMRRAFAEQRYMEARARYGSRYVEYLRYLGINPSDARLQRPEYLGGGKQTLSFSEVLKTGSGEDPTIPIGDMAGHGIAALRSNRYRKYFEEHGFVISLLTIRPRAIYMDGLHKKWSRKTKEDYFQKELELIGQQQILNKEIYFDGTAADETTFGYADRYREYREEPSHISGNFRNINKTWHFGRSFDTRPALNETFVKCTPSILPFADQVNAPFLFMANHSIQARRMVSRNPVARII